MSAPPATRDGPPGRPSDLHQYIPADLLSRVDSARRSGRTAGERRIVTLLFCDIKGSTAAASRLDPEEWTEIMNGAYERMIRPVYRYEGTVGRLMGDAILAFFGAPLAHEDDPVRAVLAGLEIVAGIQEYRAAVQREWDLDFDVRVGINTGLVVVGEVGSDLRMEYTAMGDAINLAARMEQTAQAGSVQIAGPTYRLVAPWFEIEDLGGIAVKGKDEPVPAYRVLGRKTQPGRLRSALGLESPLIGREGEWETLTRSVENLTRGQGGIIFLSGEAGLGKSRLIHELKSWLMSQEKEISWYESYSLSYETDQPYELVRRFMRALARVEPGDSVQELWLKIEPLFDGMENEKEETIRRVLGSLFGETAAGGEPPLEGEAFKGTLYTAIRSLLRHLALNNPIILVCDDLHWTDSASLDLILHSLSLVQDTPLLVLLAMRPEQEGLAWRQRELAWQRFPLNCVDVKLQPLAEEQGGQLVENLLQISTLPPFLRKLIFEKAEGNPFYVEEVVRDLIDRNVVVVDSSGLASLVLDEGAEIEIPDSVQSLLVSRIDRLSEDLRQTLQLASVIGRSFYYKVLAHISNNTGELVGQLQAFQAAQLILEAARVPEWEFIFRHALTQEAAYRTILHKQRRTFHRAVGETLEELFPDQREALSGIMARHFFEGNAYEKAFTYFLQAGDAAFRLHAAAQAIQGYQGAVTCAGEVKVSTDRLVHLYLRLGRSYELDSRYEEALDTYQDMLSLAEARRDPTLRLASWTAQCIVHAAQTPLHSLEKAREMGEAALALAAELGDPVTQAKAHWGMMIAESWGSQEYQKALLHGQTSLSIARGLGLKEQLAYTLTDLINVYWNLDQMETAREVNLESRQLWIELGNTPMLADSYSHSLWGNLHMGNYEEALEDVREGVRISRSVNNAWNHAMALLIGCPAYLERGEIGTALDNVEQGRQIAQAGGLRLETFAHYQMMAYLLTGDLERAGRLAEKIYSSKDQIIFVFLNDSLGSVAQVKVALGDLEGAERILEETQAWYEIDRSPTHTFISLLLTGAYLELAKRNPAGALNHLDYMASRMRAAGIRYRYPEALWLAGKSWLDLEDPGQARQAFQEAQEEAEATGARFTLWKILASQSDWATRQGDEESALAYRARARRMVEEIAGQAGSERQREIFLALPEVQAVFR